MHFMHPPVPNTGLGHWADECSLRWESVLLLWVALWESRHFVGFWLNSLQTPALRLLDTLHSAVHACFCFMLHPYSFVLVGCSRCLVIPLRLRTESFVTTLNWLLLFWLAQRIILSVTVLVFLWILRENSAVFIWYKSEHKLLENGDYLT